LKRDIARIIAGAEVGCPAGFVVLAHRDGDMRELVALGDVEIDLKQPDDFRVAVSAAASLAAPLRVGDSSNIFVSMKRLFPQSDS